MTVELESKAVPEPSLRRLPGYCHLLRRLAAEGEQAHVSCSHIGRALNLDPTQVRKDLAFTGVTGRPKVGYVVEELFDALEEFLGWRNAQDVFLVGAGSLGTALLGYEHFDQYGIRIVAAFDVSPYKVGKQVHGVEILHMDRLVNLARRMGIHLGILTVPVAQAQPACEAMVEGGIRAIWNFAPVALETPEGVIVQSEDLFSSLGILSSKLAGLLREESVAPRPGESTADSLSPSA